MENESLKECPYCKEQIKAAAVKCRYCGSLLGETQREEPPYAGLKRSQNGRQLGGVCMGLAKSLGISVTLIRCAFIITAFMGWGILVYVVLWVLMPMEKREDCRHEPAF
jgi:phage shock protein PspC (stress-responsive transcriptional regulator)